MTEEAIASEKNMCKNTTAAPAPETEKQRAAAVHAQRGAEAPDRVPYVRAQSGAGAADRVLDVRGLRVAFSDDFGERTVTDDISYHVNRGETLGIVGESGCGKSAASLAVMGLLGRNGRVRAGEALLEGRDLLSMDEKELDRCRGKEIAMVFQDALAGLDPVFTIGRQMEEPLRIHLGLSKKEARERAVELLRRVGVPDPEDAVKKYPHELSGGMRQRVMIATALSCGPKLLVADEPTTALDPTVQAQIMRMIRRIRDDLQMSVILITHDIGLIAQMADRVTVMYAGQIVEEAPVKELFAEPLHPYTRALLASVPSVNDRKDRVLEPIGGTVPENYSEIDGCRFQDRCRFAAEGCEMPQEFREAAPGHFVKCSRCGGHFE